MYNGLKWISENDIVKKATIEEAESIFGVKFPDDYTEIVIKNDGGYPKPNRFNLNGNEEVFNNLLCFAEDDYSNIVNTYNEIKDRLTEKVIPFAEDPFGNMICFDYRNNNQPVVVFWEHETSFNDKEAAISYICNTFSELMSILHELQE